TTTDQMQKETVMNELKLDLLEEQCAPAECTTGYTYDIPVNDGIILSSAHPNYVRPGDHVNWNLNNVVPGTLSITLSGSLFAGVTVAMMAPRQVRITGSNVNVPSWTSVTYTISGTRYTGPTTTTSFTTSVNTIMVKPTCDPPGCAGCGGNGGGPLDPPGRPRPRGHQSVVTSPV
ncbi:MAG: hypothetical protein ACLGI9_04500, partial [Thermoanaerobaculia bacterium]